MNSIMNVWKYRWKGLLKAINFLQKSNKKADSLCMKFSSTSSTSVQRCLYPKINAPIFCCPFFWKLSQPSGQDQQNGKQTYCWIPPYSFSINVKDTASHISMDSEGVYLSRIFLEFFPKPVYFTMVAGKFLIHGIKITIKHICQPKNSCCSFLLMPPSKTLSQVFIITPQTEGNNPFFRNSVFWRSIFSPAEGGKEGYGVEEITKIKLTRVLVISFDKFHNLCNLSIVGFCFVVP